MRPLPVTLLVFGVLTLAGCGSGPDQSPVAPPSYDSEAMAKSALAELDKNANGTIEGVEFDACPGLKMVVAGIDTNKDSKLSLDELKARFETYRNAGAVGYTLRVTLDGNPLPDAAVRLIPEIFMNGAVKEATGKTSADGTVTNYTVGGREMPGVPPGVYRIAVTKDGVSIPAKFNTETTQGCEVSGGGRGGSSGFDVKITTK